MVYIGCRKLVACAYLSPVRSHFFFVLASKLVARCSEYDAFYNTVQATLPAIWLCANRERTSFVLQHAFSLELGLMCLFYDCVTNAPLTPTPPPLFFSLACYEQFALAWYLANQAAAGVKPPSSLPANLVPLSKRAAAPRSAANPF